MKIPEKIALYRSLCSNLLKCQNLKERIELVEALPSVRETLKNNPNIHTLIQSLTLEQAYVLYLIIALDQAQVVFFNIQEVGNPLIALRKCADDLLEVERFYDSIGGVVGYYLMVLTLINLKQEGLELSQDNITYSEPEGFNIEKDTPEVRKFVRKGIESLSSTAEIYPVGGAGDRLKLKDERTGESLPAACLNFCGRTLFEGLMRDLQGREFLHYKLLGTQQVVPVAIMTSHEKENHKWIIDICELNQWFGRPRDNFRFFVQNLVPVVTIDGDFAMKEPLVMHRKPSGHGVIWKVAEDSGVFDWLQEKKCDKALVRQINNPLAGTDYTLFALSGYGAYQRKLFGFASCPRKVGSSEGMDVLCEKKEDHGYSYCITNVEYTEFQHRGIKDVPIKEGSPFSRYPANTNILYVDLDTVRKASILNPVPGKLINMKSSLKCYTPYGEVEKKAGRLESTMQNIADEIVDHFDHPLSKNERGLLSSFLLYNKREKTIGVTKEAYVPGQSNGDTPEHCFYELMMNYHDLLKNYCDFEMPPLGTEVEYLKNGPSFVALFHPALGGLYSVIAQKIRKGKMSQGSELILEISEIDIQNLDLEGSLIVEAENIMGSIDHNGELHFDESQMGKCTLNNVKIRNKGTEQKETHNVWKRTIPPVESTHILIHGNGEFYAENVVLEGEIFFEVPDGYRLVVYDQTGEIAWHYEQLEAPTWEWDYRFDEEDRIQLKRVAPI